MKKLTSSLVVGLTILSFAAPVFAHDGEKPENSSSNNEIHTKEISDAPVCNVARLANAQEKLNHAAADQFAKSDKHRAEVNAKLEKNRAARDAKFATVRAERDARGFKNAGVQNVVEGFRSKVDSALSARPAAVEAALATFRATIDTLTATRKASGQAALDTLKSTVCSTTDKSAKEAAWKAFRETITAAKKAFREGRATALEILKAAFKDAQITFVESVKSAGEAKKGALEELRGRK